MARFPLPIALFSGLAILGSATAAHAGGARGYRDKADADIDSLTARIEFADGQWALAVRFDIEIEDARRGDRFDLVLTLADGRCDLRDQLGRPITVVVPLLQPVSIEDGGEEIRFRDEVVVNLPDGVFARPDRLRLHARVISANSGRSLDDDTTSVKSIRHPTWTSTRIYRESFWR